MPDKNILFKNWKQGYFTVVLQCNVKKQLLQANSYYIMMTI